VCSDFGHYSQSLDTGLGFWKYNLREDIKLICTKEYVYTNIEFVILEKSLTGGKGCRLGFFIAVFL
jgi:hypothetical protein